MSNSTTYKIRPLGNYVFVKLPPEDDKKTPGGIIIPTVAQTKPQLAEIVAVGPGLVSLITGDLIPLGVHEGDFVIINKFGCQEAEMPDGSKIHFLGEGDIISVLEEVPADEIEDDVVEGEIVDES